MKKFTLTIVTPKGRYFKGEVEELYLKASYGYLGVMANHDTLITAVDIAPGFVIKDNKKEYYAIFDGILRIRKEGVLLIVSNIEPADTIDVARAKKAQERALERLNKKSEGVDIKRAELALKRAIARLNSVDKKFI